MESDIYVTVREAANLLGVTESAIRNATLEGRLPSMKRDGRKFISISDLDKYRGRSRPQGKKPTGRPKRQGRSILEIVKSKTGPRLFKDPDSIDRYIDEERNSWDD